VTGTTTAPGRALPLSPWHSVGPLARACRRPFLAGVVVAFVLVSVWYGYPTGRDVITGWVLLLLLAACGGDVRVWATSVVRDWLPLTAVLFLYDRLRGSADAFGGSPTCRPWPTGRQAPRAPTTLTCCRSCAPTSCCSGG
jgi:hypothetical protein